MQFTITIREHVIVAMWTHINGSQQKIVEEKMNPTVSIFRILVKKSSVTRWQLADRYWLSQISVPKKPFQQCLYSVFKINS